MPLSTFNSDQRVPPHSLGRIWFFALFAAILLLGSGELFWRSRGHIPSVVDDVALWSWHRARLEHGNKKTMVLLGASRIQLDVSMDTLHDAFPDRDIIQLAIDGKHPPAVLRDLAENTTFSGIVLCSITAMGFQRQFRQGQQHFVDHYHRASTVNERLNRFIASVIQEHLVIIDPYLKIKRLIEQYIKSGRLPKPRFLITRHDRSRLADYTMIDSGKRYAYRVKRIREIYAENPPVPPEAWRQQAAELKPLVEKITRRGGMVVFMRLPSTGEHWEIDEAAYPRKDYWDRIAGLTGAVTIHFKDVEGMRNLVCPEGSHLDRRQAPAFTRALVRELVSREIVSSR